MPEPVNAHATLLKRGNGATPEVFETVAKITSDISGPNLTRTGPHAVRGREDTWMRKVPGLPDAGQISFEIAYQPQLGSHVNLLADFRSGAMGNWQLAFPDPELTVWQVRGYVANFEPGLPEDGAMTASVTLELDGEPTFNV